MKTQIHCHSLYLNAFCMIDGYFSQSWNFYKLKKATWFLGGTSFAESLNYLVPPSVFNFKFFMDANSSSFIRSQCILHHWVVLFSQSWNFYKLKKGDVISGGNEFCRKSELFGPPFCISILKFLWTQIHRHSSDLNVFSIIEEYFSQSLEISTS